jgi:hypothetical protein
MERGSGCGGCLVAFGLFWMWLIYALGSSTAFRQPRPGQNRTLTPADLLTELLTEASFADVMFFAGPFLLGVFILLATWYRSNHKSK